MKTEQRENMKLELLVVLAVAGLVPRLAEGLQVSKCELKTLLEKAAMNISQTEVGKSNATIENLIAKIICHVEKATHFNTSVVTQWKYEDDRHHEGHQRGKRESGKDHHSMPTAHPEDHTAHPEDHTAHPEDHTAHPEDHTAHPEDHTAHPEDHTAHPEAHHTRGKRESGKDHHSMPTAHPEDHTAHPEDHTAHPEDHTAHPEDHTAHPEDHTAHPEDHTAHPEDHTAHPEDHTAHPEAHTNFPTPIRTVHPEEVHIRGKRNAVEYRPFPTPDKHIPTPRPSTLTRALLPTRAVPTRPEHPNGSPQDEYHSSLDTTHAKDDDYITHNAPPTPPPQHEDATQKYTTNRPAQPTKRGKRSAHHLSAKTSSENNSEEETEWTLYGLFQLSDHVICASGSIPSLNLCQMNCSALIDDNLSDDINCMETIGRTMESGLQHSMALTTMLKLLFPKDCERTTASTYLQC
ncbi:hypothetical protein DPEC_G00176580 [Dallia pectoralis]|uniref:Uncharacterized protein n=1 Tax=Dallia pectoralis TaxID=75939 RepID=A0ACC2GF90_DALPE|nr:hypothetical protein DPEC_G00176580 [Dallia pectoralis]